MLLQEEFDFIEKHKTDDPKSLAFKTHGMFKHTMGFLLNQIKLRQKTKKKLPAWYANSKLLFPTNLSSEQCSSEITAAYKASLFDGDSFIDLTGGLGVDTLAFGKNFRNGVYTEQNKELYDVANHNFKVLKASHVSTYNGNGIHFLKDNFKCYDLVYIDPDRRPNEIRTYDLEDCQPNIVEYLDLLLEKGKKVLIKASPMVHINSCLKQLHHIEEVIVVSYKNECKEILFIASKKFKQEVRIRAVELDTVHHKSCELSKLDQYELNYQTGGKYKYIYDPFVCFRKAGMTPYLANMYKLSAFNATGTLLATDNFIEDFPGRIFQVIKVISADKKTLKKEGIKRGNFVTRGFFLSAEKFHQQLRVNKGGDLFLIPKKNELGNTMLFLCNKL